MGAYFSNRYNKIIQTNYLIQREAFGKNLDRDWWPHSDWRCTLMLDIKAASVVGISVQESRSENVEGLK